MERYVKLKQIGQGAFGKAFLVVEKSRDDGRPQPARKSPVAPEQLVLKEILTTSRADCEEAIKEAKVLQAMDHPNIVRFKESFVTSRAAVAAANPPMRNAFGRPNGAAIAGGGNHATVVCIVTEFVGGGDLRHQLERQQARASPMAEATVWRWFIQLCLALKHVHDRKILHRDLKPENIFIHKPSNERAQSNLNEWVLKLGDFGIAKVLNSTLELAQTMAGTPYYFSPEIWLGSKYNNKTDIWSLGCILYEMLTLRRPFDGSNQRQLCQHIIQGSFAPIPPKWYSAAIIDLVNKMLAKNPRQRPSVNDLLHHPNVLYQMQGIFSQSLLKRELAHTVLHGVCFNDHLEKHKAQEKSPPRQPQQQQQQQQQLQRRLLPDQKQPATPQQSPAVVIPVATKPADFRPAQVPQRVPVAEIRERAAAAIQPSAPPKLADEAKTREQSRTVQQSPHPTPNANKERHNNHRPIVFPPGHAPVQQVKHKNVVCGERVARTPLRLHQQTPGRVDIKAKAQAQVSAPRNVPAQKIEQKAQLGASRLADRVAAFNEQWQEQKHNILQNLQCPVEPCERARTPSPPSSAPDRSRMTSSTSPPRPSSAEAQSSTKTHPANETPSPSKEEVQEQIKASAPSPPPKDPATAGPPRTRLNEKQLEKAKQRQEFRNELRMKRQAARQQPRASPLDDPIILVQDIPHHHGRDVGDHSPHGVEPAPMKLAAASLEDPVLDVVQSSSPSASDASAQEDLAFMPKPAFEENRTVEQQETEATPPSDLLEARIAVAIVPVVEENDEPMGSAEIVDSSPYDNEFERVLCQLQAVLDSNEHAYEEKDGDADDDNARAGEEVGSTANDNDGFQPNTNDESSLPHASDTTEVRILASVCDPPAPVAPIQQQVVNPTTSPQPASSPVRAEAVATNSLPHTLLEMPLFKQALHEWLHEPKDQVLGKQMSIFTRYDFSSDQWDSLIWIKQYIQELLVPPASIEKTSRDHS